MALNLTTIKKNGITQVTTKRECKVSGNPGYEYMSSNPTPGRSDYYSPRENNPANIIPAGTTLQVVCVQPSIPMQQMSGVKVVSPAGRSFLILPGDVGKLCQ